MVCVGVVTVDKRKTNKHNQKTISDTPRTILYFSGLMTPTLGYYIGGLIGTDICYGAACIGLLYYYNNTEKIKKYTGSKKFINIALPFGLGIATNLLCYGIYKYTKRSICTTLKIGIYGIIITGFGYYLNKYKISDKKNKTI